MSLTLDVPGGSLSSLTAIRHQASGIGNQPSAISVEFMRPGRDRTGEACVCDLSAHCTNLPIIRVELHIANGHVLEQCGTAGPSRPVEGEVGRVVMLGEAALEHQIDSLTRVQRIVAGDQANREPKVTWNDTGMQTNWITRGKIANR